MKYVISWSFQDQGGQDSYEASSVIEAFLMWELDMECEGLKSSEVVKLTISRPDVHLTTRSTWRKLKSERPTG